MGVGCCKNCKKGLSLEQKNEFLFPTSETDNINNNNFYTENNEAIEVDFIQTKPKKTKRVSINLDKPITTNKKSDSFFFGIFRSKSREIKGILKNSPKNRNNKYNNFNKLNVNFTSVSRRSLQPNIRLNIKLIEERKNEGSEKNENSFNDDKDDNANTKDIIQKEKFKKNIKDIDGVFKFVKRKTKSSTGLITTNNFLENESSIDENSNKNNDNKIEI